MNVSDLLHDSPSQLRRRPPLQHDSPQSAPPSVPSASASPQAQHQPQHPHPHPLPPQPPPGPSPQFPTQPSPYYPFPRTDPPPMHRITPRPSSQIQPSPIDPTPAMASLQHPSPSAPPHVHPPAPWGPPPRQGSSPLAPASLHRTPHHQQPPSQIKSVMPGSERSPIVQRAHASGSSTPSNIAAHSPPSKSLLTTPAGVLILDKRTAEEQMARPPIQGPSSHPTTSPGGFRPGRDREKEWDHREREDLDMIRHPPRERVIGPFDRERDRERPLPSPRDRAMASPHDRSLASSHERPIPSPHERERHMHRMSPLGRPSPAQGASLRPSAQQSPPGPSHRIPPPHDRMPPPLHERPPHDRDRIHPPPLPPPHRQGPPLLPGQGQFQTHPPEWDPARERDMREREPPMGMHPRDLRDKDLDPPRDPDHERAYLRERDRQRPRERDPGLLPPRERDFPREREFVPRDIEVLQREREMRERELHVQWEREREMRERELHVQRDREREREIRERELHVQRERERMVHLREGETGPGVPPRGHDRERRTHSRIPSPGMGMGGPGIPLTSAGAAGPGAPGPHHPPPHDLRERELFMTERERQMVWEQRDREMGRQYRDRMPDRDRMGIPIPERDSERMALTDRERAAERERAMYERERMVPDRERPFLDRERERMERDRFLERERMVIGERERAMHERERGLPERGALERERVILERPGERERMPMRHHPFDMMERERTEVFELERERERIEAMERDRERGLEAGASGAGPSRDRDGDKKVVDISMVDRDRAERPTGPADREHMDKRERERELLERGREPMNTITHEGEPTEINRERLKARERFEMLQRELNDLSEREKIGGLDIVERERLSRLERERFEILERERLEALERERLEMLERMPSAEELAKTRKEREQKPFVSLGTYVWPRTPFPYYFPEWIPTPVVEQDKSEAKVTEAGLSSGSLVSGPQSASATTQMPTELRLAILVPPSFLPPARPQKFRLWGGGLPPPPPFPFTPSIYCLSRRRVYTDDSDVIQCAVHAGLLTWSGIARAKREGRTIRVVLALVPTLASASGAVKSGQCESRAALNGMSANGHVNGTASVPRTRTSTPLPPPASSVPSTSSVSGEPQPPGYAGGVWANRFIGGWGESFYGEESAGRGENAGRMTSSEEAEDDGRGCVSCGWGWGHDGSAFEVISVDVAEPNAHVAPGLGRRNRAQRLAEYAQRRADVLGLVPSPSPLLLDVTNTPKRKRLNVDFAETKNAGLSEQALVAEEARKMQAMTISFGVPDRGKSKTGIGFKYEAQAVQCALFPHLHEDSVVRQPAKRRKTDAENQENVDSTEDERGVVLESTQETYLVTWNQGNAEYTLSVLEPRQHRVNASTSIPPGAASKTQNTHGAEERGTTDGASDPPEQASSTTRDATSSKRPSIPADTPRVLRSNISSNDFSFENDVIVIKAPIPMDDKKMDVDDAVEMRVLRWRWYLQ